MVPSEGFRNCLDGKCGNYAGESGGREEKDADHGIFGVPRGDGRRIRDELFRHRVWGVFDWIGAVELGFWCWIGFTAPTMLGMVLWEGKPVKYYAIVSGFWLVSFVAMAVVLVLMA